LSLPGRGSGQSPALGGLAAGPGPGQPGWGPGRPRGGAGGGALSCPSVEHPQWKRGGWRKLSRPMDGVQDTGGGPCKAAACTICEKSFSVGISGLCDRRIDFARRGENNPSPTRRPRAHCRWKEQSGGAGRCTSNLPAATTKQADDGLFSKGTAPVAHAADGRAPRRKTRQAAKKTVVRLSALSAEQFADRSGHLAVLRVQRIHTPRAAQRTHARTSHGCRCTASRAIAE
jgi:hypothetical protein